MNTGEKIIWVGKSSQWTNLKTYARCVLMAAMVALVYLHWKLAWVGLFLLYPAGRALFAWYETYSGSYRLSTTRLLCKKGVFNRVTTETETSKIREVILSEPWYKRIIGLGDIRLHVYGYFDSNIVLTDIARANKVKELFSELVKQHQRENPESGNEREIIINQKNIS
ncbi:MAG: PH domain-containing protein [Prevotellaceae bacterium]|jgi:uncharacterized membrane protein YdbT with pleckstrin-like domain|nr:PH domain-containing protein [Prevotellaceae bacterium]